MENNSVVAKKEIGQDEKDYCNEFIGDISDRPTDFTEEENAEIEDEIKGYQDAPRDQVLMEAWSIKRIKDILVGFTDELQGIINGAEDLELLKTNLLSSIDETNRSALLMQEMFIRILERRGYLS